MAIDSTGINKVNFGYRTFETIADSTLTTDVNDCGKVLNFTHAAPVVTLHAAAAGQSLTFRVSKHTQTLTLNPNAADAITGLDLNATGNKDVYMTNQPAGSFITLVGTGSNTWLVAEVSGAITKES